MSKSPVLVAAKQRRRRNSTELDVLMAGGQRRGSLTPDEKSRFETIAAEIEADDETIKRLKAEGRRMRVVARANAELYGNRAGGIRGTFVTAEPMTYSQDPASPSYLLDLARRLPGFGVGAESEQAEARLVRHRREIEIESRANPEVERMLVDSRMQEQRVNPNTTAGTGGEFVPPLWLVSQYVPFARAGRVLANRTTVQNLPPGIDVINIPKITTGSLTANQIANAAPVASQDIKTSTVSAPVLTIAGQQDISLQLLEQSPIAMDGVVFQDLAADYDRQLDTQILTGTGAQGQHQGVLTQTGATSNTDITKINLVTCSSPTFFDAATSATQYRSIANGANQIETLRFQPATAIWVHPRRAASWSFAADTQARPLFVSYSPYNATGTGTGGTIAQGVVGDLYGLPVVKDANLPTTWSNSTPTGGTADVIVVVKEDDLYLWEGTMRLRALPEILSGTLQVRFQVYAYSAFIPSRFPPSTSLINGSTGLAAPGF